MKTLVLISLFLSSTLCLAAGQLHCITYHDGTIASTGNDMERFAIFCHDQMSLGGVCFTGARIEVIELIYGLNDYDLYGGETYFTDVHYSGRTGISYELWDGPSNILLSEQNISRCSRSFFEDAHQD